MLHFCPRGIHCRKCCSCRISRVNRGLTKIEAPESRRIDEEGGGPHSDTPPSVDVIGTGVLGEIGAKSRPLPDGRHTE